jgi:RNA polymerase primary sigma factor
MNLDQKNELVEIEEGMSREEYLLAKAAEQGFVTYDDVLAAFPQAEENMEELEDILATLMETGVKVGAPEEVERQEAVVPTRLDQSAVVTDQQARFDTIAIDDTIGLYLKEVGRVPLLTAAEEVRLAKRMEAGKIAQEELSQDGLNLEKRVEMEEVVQDGLAAREHLIRANSRLVISVAKKYIGRGVPFLDLIQEGNIGLIRAANKFNYHLGHKFLYAPPTSSTTIWGISSRPTQPGGSGRRSRGRLLIRAAPSASLSTWATRSINCCELLTD